MLLACLVPRYISAFKLRIGLNISMFTIAVLFVWLMYSMKIKIYQEVESSFFYVWFILIVGSVWRAEKIGTWAYFLVWISTAILFQQILYKCDGRVAFDAAARAAADALLIHSLIGLYEVSVDKYLFETGNVSSYDYGKAAIGIFHNLNDYATFVTTMLPFSVYRLFSEKKTPFRIYYAALFGLSIYMILCSRSRAAMLTLLILAVTYLHVFCRNSNKRKLILLAVVGFLLVLYMSYAPLRQIVTEFFQQNTINEESGSDKARINLINNGLHFLVVTHGFGVGAGNLNEWLSSRSIFNIGQLTYIHNWYAEILVTFGIPFMLLYVYFHLKVFFSILAAGTKSKQIFSLENTILLSFVSFSIVSISSSSNFYSEWVWMYLVLVSAFSMLLCRQKKEKVLSAETDAQAAFW